MKPEYPCSTNLRKYLGNSIQEKQFSNCFHVLGGISGEHGRPSTFPCVRTNRLMSLVSTNQERPCSLAMTGEMPCPAVKYSDKSKAVEKQFVISRVNTYVSRAPCWSDSCPRRTREKIMKRPYLVVCTLLLSLCQDRTTASWMLVSFFFPFCVLCFHWNQKQKRYKFDGNIILAWFWSSLLMFKFLSCFKVDGNFGA